jgi:hypothetical protein
MDSSNAIGDIKIINRIISMARSIGVSVDEVGPCEEEEEEEQQQQRLIEVIISRLFMPVFFAVL